jgi:outer membrane immunogenic protein
MKKFLLGSVALIALGAVPAMAADLAARPYTKAPPIAAAAYDWSGFYIGANGGWGTSSKCWSFGGIAPVIPVYVDSGCHDASGGVAGGQIGYNWQVGTWVFGLEAQGDWADLTGSNVSLTDATAGHRSKVDAFGLFTGRIGYALNNALLYAKGGAAVVSDKYNAYAIATGVDFATGSETRWGGTVGAGLEYGFTPNWSAAVEYDHLFMGTKNLTFGPILDQFRIKQDVDIVTARINYRWGGPVVARY